MRVLARDLVVTCASPFGVLPKDKGFHWLCSADWLAALAIRPASTIGRSALHALGIPPYRRQPDRSHRDIDRDSLTIGWWRLARTRWVTTCGRGASSFVPTTSGYGLARDAASRVCAARGGNSRLRAEAWGGRRHGLRRGGHRSG